MSTRTRPIVVAQFADGTPATDFHPRLKAVEFLRETIADRRAGGDPYDPAIFILHAGEHEKVWAARALELCGEVICAFDLPDGTKRFRVIVEADVRMELHLDGEGAPLMDDEPLASRRVDDSVVSLISEAREQREAERVRNSDSVMAAIGRAKDAYDRRYPYGVEPQLVIRTDTEGEAS